MATAAQLNANRANAQHCTGPKTEEGRATSSRNATRHGLTSTRVLIEGDDVEEYQRKREEYFAEYRPATPTEEGLTALVADTYWRLQRALGVEAEFTLETLTAPRRDIDGLGKLGRYVSAARRDHQTAITQLREVQADRVKAEKSRMREEESKARRTPQPPTPPTTSAEIGFVSQSPRTGDPNGAGNVAGVEPSQSSRANPGRSAPLTVDPSPLRRAG